MPAAPLTPVLSAPVTLPTGLRSDLAAACGAQPGAMCRTVFHLTHSDAVAGTAGTLLTVPLRILLIAVVAIVLRRLARRVIDRLVRSTVAGSGLEPLARVRERARERLTGNGEEHALPVGLRRAQRAETTGSLLRNVASVLIFGVAFVLVLGELGVNLAPIVASAGIVGVAVGFGAQNLVRDFLTGIFMILEDQYGVGDVVDLGKANGTVEAVGLRTTRVRDVEGTVWHVRNGDIAAVGNKSQAWARALIDVPVAYASDLQVARTVIKEAADAVWRDPDYAPKILEEPEVWGAESFEADGVLVRLVVKTVPLEQWVVARALRESIKNAFDAAGVEIPFAQRSVWVRHADGDGADLGVAVTQLPRPGTSATAPLPVPQHAGAAEQGGG